jgi:hypothetical protein
MGSEQGFQVNKVDPEAEGQAKKSPKNRAKNQLPEPAAKAIDIIPNKTEQSVIDKKATLVNADVKEKDAALSPGGIRGQAEESDKIDPLELHNPEPAETGADLFKPTGSPTETFSLQAVGNKNQAAKVEQTSANSPETGDGKLAVNELPELPGEYHDAFGGETVTINLSEIGAEGEIRLWARKNANFGNRSNPAREEVTTPQSANEFTKPTQYDEPSPDWPTWTGNRSSQARPSPIVAANRSNAPAGSSEQFNQLLNRQTAQAERVEDMIDQNRIPAEQLVASTPNIFGYGPIPETKPRHDLESEDDGRLKLPEVVDDTVPTTPFGHRLEHSVWHSIEVDSKTGRPVENPTFDYGLEYNREQAPEHIAESDEEVAVASGQLAVGGISNIDMPLPQPIPFSMPADSTQPVKNLTPALAGFGGLQMSTSKLPADFKTDFWLWLLLGLVIIADLIAIIS